MSATPHPSPPPPVAHPDSTARVAPCGELDIASAPRFDEVLRRAQHEAALVVVDLRGVALLASSGVHCLRAAVVRARCYGGRLVVVRGPAAVNRILALSGLDSELELVDRPPGGSRVEGGR